MILLASAFKNIVFLPKIIRKEKPDVVIINSSVLPLCGLVAKFMGKRVVWHIREVISTEKSRILKWLISANIQFCAERVVVASEYSQQDMFNLGIKKVSVVYNGVDLKRFQSIENLSEINTGLGLNTNDKIVGFVGQIYREKGWEILVKAAFVVIQKLKNVKFIIAGIVPHPTEEKVFHQMVKDLRLTDNFIFLGQIFNVERILPLMTCLAFPSTTPEGFGRSIIEAMACGVPVIASCLGGPAEIVIDQVTGLLVEPNNPKALSKALIDMLADDQKVKSMGQAGRKRVEEVYDIEKMTSKLAEIYGQ
jgi:glycosyltransferase involved in cell wall biosynthesis